MKKAKKADTKTIAVRAICVVLAILMVGSSVATLLAML